MRLKSPTACGREALRFERLEDRRLLALDSVGFELETFVDQGVLNQPVTFDVADDGRVFVAEKDGTVAVLDANGQRLSTFLDIRGRVNSFQDRGLLSLALDPDFSTNGHVYLNYTKEIDSVNPELNPGIDLSLLDQGGHPGGINALGEVIRVTVSAGDANLADMSTETLVHDGFFHVGGSHSVGDIDFDNDNNLIFTWGDGGFNVNARLAAQNPDDPRGKVYRINKDTFEGVAGNPFYEAGDPDSQRSKVWALGVRNSWKMTVDQATGDVYIAEVTDNGPEEVNIIRADGSTLLNFGWPWFTADNPSNRGPEYDPANNLPTNFQYESPFVDLNKPGGYFAIVGGAVYRGDNYPSEFVGQYIFGEIGSGDLFIQGPTGEEMAFGNVGSNEGVVDIQLGPDGNLWATSLFTGRIQKIVYTGEGDGINQQVEPSARASRTAGVGPLTVQFDATGSRGFSGAPLGYAWDFNGDGAIDSTEARPVHTYTTVGRTIARLTVIDGIESAQQIVEIDVLATEPNDDNLALGKPTKQTNTRGTGLDGGIASRAVDGNTSGAFVNNVFTDSVTHTQTTRTPFWEVDLENTADISGVSLWNRDSAPERLSDFYVMISDEPITSGNPNAASALPGIKFAFFSGTAGENENFSLSDFEERLPDGSTAPATDLNGRYVRVQITSQDGILSLAEVQVFGEAGPTARFFDLDEPKLLRPGDDYQVQVDAYDSGGLIDNVQLFVNDVLVRQENFSPYQWFSDAELQDLPTGSYRLRAVATDNDGRQATVERTIAVGIEGDYNRDSVVSAADYVVFRDTIGAAVDPHVGADGDGDASVDQDDYPVWSSYFGLDDQNIPDPPMEIHASDFAGLLIDSTEQGDAFDNITLTFTPSSGGGAVTIFTEDFESYSPGVLNDPATHGGWDDVLLNGVVIEGGGSNNQIASGTGSSINFDAFNTAPLTEEGVFTLELVSRIRDQFRQQTALVDANGQTLIAVGNLTLGADTGFEVVNGGGTTLLQANPAANPVSFSSHRYFDLRLTYNTATGAGVLEVGPGFVDQAPNGPYELVGNFQNPLIGPTTTSVASPAVLGAALAAASGANAEEGESPPGMPASHEAANDLGLLEFAQLDAHLLPLSTVDDAAPRDQPVEETESDAAFASLSDDPLALNL